MRMADCAPDCAYLLGNWATDRLSPGDRQLISSMFGISTPTDRPATVVAQRRKDPVGMALRQHLKNVCFLSTGWE